MTDLDLVGSAKSGWSIGETFVTVALDILQILMRPMALLTQVFVRKDFGERYFTQGAFGIGLLILIVMRYSYRHIVVKIPFSLTYALLGRDVGENIEKLPLFFDYCLLWILLFWTVCFGAAYGENRIRLWRRYRRGERWHSRCSGVPRIPRTSPLLQYLLVMAAAVVVDLTGCSELALLVVASLAATIAIDRAEVRRIRIAVMDSIDAQIEAETLENAIENRLTPQQAQGLVVRLPKALGQLLTAESKRARGSGVSGEIASGIIEAKAPSPLPSRA